MANKIPMFWIQEKDPETIELFVGEKSMGTYNHDDHGWDGMRAVEELFEEIAEILGTKVTRL